MFCGNRSACPWWLRSDGTLSVSDSSWIDRQICFSGFEQNLHWMSSSSLWRTRCSLVFIHSPETKTEMFIFPSRWWRGLKLPHRWTSALENTQRFKLTRVVASRSQRQLLMNGCWEGEQTSVCSVTAAGFRWRGVFSDWVEMWCLFCGLPVGSVACSLPTCCLVKTRSFIQLQIPDQHEVCNFSVLFKRIKVGTCQRGWESPSARLLLLLVRLWRGGPDILLPSSTF